jgi:hypothetical protein
MVRGREMDLGAYRWLDCTLGHIVNACRGIDGVDQMRLGSADIL